MDDGHAGSDPAAALDDVLVPGRRWVPFIANAMDSAPHMPRTAMASALQAVIDCCRQRPELTFDEAATVLCREAVAVQDWPYLRCGPVCEVGAGVRLSTVMQTLAFGRFIVDQRAPVDDEHDDPLPLEPEDTRAGLDQYRRSLEATLQRAGWHQPGAALGKPFPGPLNCWLSTDQFGDHHDAHTYTVDQQALRRREERGLASDSRRPSFLVEVSFSGSDLQQTGTTLHRPLAFDGGNLHFAVAHGSEQAAEIRSAGWGTTLHLGKLRADPPQACSGVAEAVVQPLEVDLLGALQVTFLGRAAASNDDEALVARREARLDAERSLQALRTGAAGLLTRHAD